jgi:2-polyprenyl-3-methyl-5-hydroxy-6-metoxy-1,4-benzoquinol methylase
MTSSDLWDTDAASRYDDASSPMFSPEVLGPTVSFLAELAGDGQALELAIGTGRVALPLFERDVAVTGIELSEPMVEQLRRKASSTEIPVAVSDMATTQVDGVCYLVHLVFNTLRNARRMSKSRASVPQRTTSLVVDAS